MEVWKWNQAIRDDETVTKTLLAVAYIHGTYAAPKTGRDIYPAVETVAKAAGISRSRCSEYVKELVARGWLVPDGKAGRTVRYRLGQPVPSAAHMPEQHVPPAAQFTVPDVPWGAHQHVPSAAHNLSIDPSIEVSKELSNQEPPY